MGAAGHHPDRFCELVDRLSQRLVLSLSPRFGPSSRPTAPLEWEQLHLLKNAPTLNGGFGVRTNRFGDAGCQGCRHMTFDNDLYVLDAESQ
jgi:hypothetical protein